MLSRLAVHRGALRTSSFITTTSTSRLAPQSAMRMRTNAPRRLYSNAEVPAAATVVAPAEKKQEQVPMIEYCGVMVPDLKVPERVVDSIVEKLTGGMENPLLTEFVKMKKLDTESLANFFTNTMDKLKPQPYKTRYPNVSIEDLLLKFDELYAKKPYMYDDRFKSYFIHGLGHSEQEFDEIILGKTPQFFRQDRSIDFQEVSRCLGFNREFTRRWKHIESIIGQLESLSKEDVKLYAIDWDFWEEKLGTDAVQVTKKALDSAVREVPMFPVELALDAPKTYFDPLVDMIKDEVVDEMPYLEHMVNEEVKMGALLEHLDKHGDIDVDELLDNYFPDVRDEIDLEIENENWDYEYQEEMRAMLEGKTMADFIVTRDEFREFIEHQWNEAIRINQRAMAAGSTPLESAMKELAKAQDNLKRIETEIATIKGKDEQHDEHAPAGTAEEAVQDEAERESRDKDPFKLVVQSYITKLYNLEPDYWQKQEAKEREAREKAAAEKAAAEKAAAEKEAEEAQKKKKK